MTQRHRSPKRSVIGPLTISHVQKRVAGRKKNGQNNKSTLTAIYTRLLVAFGPQKWWPAQTQFEVIVGAVLTQNTNWENVEKALTNLKNKNLLIPQALHNISVNKLALLIKSSGYFNVKAKRLKNFISFLFEEYNGHLNIMAKEECFKLRRKLLQINGIGPETADSILLYAFDKPVFVVDAYTKRILSRHNFIDSNEDYHGVQKLFMGSLKSDVKMFNEYHALIVHLGKNYCKPNPLCEQCTLNNFHYSLTMKCSACHRALPKKQDRNSIRGHYFCNQCCAKGTI